MYNNWQQDLFQLPYSEELELLFKASQDYDWHRIEKEIGPRFKEAAERFHREQKPCTSCPHKVESTDDDQNLALFELMDFQSYSPERNNGNPKGAGRKGQPFIAYLKAIELAPILHIEQNMTAIALHLRINSDYLKACGFRYPPSERTIQDFDQIMSEAGLWEMFRDETYQINVDDRIIKFRSGRDTLRR